ncbi:MAG TPA: FCD domain-containing protein, partial [Gammaproteobacteria bacterium]|nr:FCD domain-containing protein [Gammaproteobacteria bacterium]
SRLRDLFPTFDQSEVLHANIDEYYDTNIAEGLFIHMRAIRVRTIRERNRVEKSIIDHLRIIEAIEQRQTVVAEQLVRDHALKLAAHVDTYVDYLD